MTVTEALPIACTLSSGDYTNRIAWIADLNKDALLDHERRDLVLNLRYSPKARSRVRELVRSEQTCCVFLHFDLQESTHEIRLTITAPEDARAAADTLFEHFIGEAKTSLPAASCTCASSTSTSKT